MQTVVLWDVQSEHLKEAGFLWAQRERALRSPGLVLADVEIAIEDRLLAHLDALLLLGPRGEPLLREALQRADPGPAAAAAYLLLEQGEAGVAAVLQRLGTATGALSVGLERALELCGAPGLEPQLLAAAAGAAPSAPLLRALAARRLELWPQLGPWLADADPEVRAAAVHVAAASGQASCPGRIIQALSDPAPPVRAAALAAGLGLGLRAALDGARALSSGDGEDAAQALLTLALAGEASPLVSAAGAGSLRSVATWALGFTGDVRAADACVELMHEPELAPMAGEAFAALTGITIAGDLMANEPEPEPEEEIAQLHADAQDALGPYPGGSTELPTPDCDAVEDCWAFARARFDPSQRYLAGRPFGLAAVVDALERSPMRRRGPLALALAARTAGLAGCPQRLWAWRQRAALAEAARVPARSFERPLADLLRT